MVKKESPTYLFIGQDSLSKDIKLKTLRQEFLKPDIEQFNLDISYARELSLKDLQEKLLCLPVSPIRNTAQIKDGTIVSNGVRTKKRIIVIKDAGELKEESKEFIFNYVKKPYAWVILVLDINRQEPRDEFLSRISKYAQAYYFKETIPPDTFMLVRQIDLRRPDYALRLLSQLLQNGERPERILGGLRYAWERNLSRPLEKRKRLRLILNCDIDIKTGRLKACFALEKLVVNLCCLSKAFR